MKQDFIQFAPLFTGLADDERATLTDNFVQGTTSANSALFKSGDRADGLYLVGDGLCAPGHGWWCESGHAGSRQCARRGQSLPQPALRCERDRGL